MRVLASMRPGQQGPGNRPLLVLRQRGALRFNEAGATRPRKRPGLVVLLAGVRRFNEAGATRPRKPLRSEEGQG